MAGSPTLIVRREAHDAVVRLTLDRPAVHNALDDALVDGLLGALVMIRDDPRVRVMILDGNGPSFCAGADIAGMRAALALDEAGNRRAAARLAELFRELDACPVPVIVLVQGVALGGGVGLIAAADHVIATVDARFGLTETRLGILPSVIAPYVMARIGAGATRSLVLTARRFDAPEAQRIGLVHSVAPDATALIASGREIVDAVLGCGPQATRIAKRLLRDLPAMQDSAAFEHTVDLIARVRVSDEAQEGLRAFLEKRRPSWADGP